MASILCKSTKMQHIEFAPIHIATIYTTNIHIYFHMKRWSPSCSKDRMLEIFLAYFQPIRIEYSKSQSKSQKSQSKEINPGH